jgi:hypothetical protein
VISIAFACEFVSSWHLGVLLLRDSCFSWWFPPSRRLGAAEEVWDELEIVHGRLRLLVIGFAPSPGEES